MSSFYIVLKDRLIFDPTLSYSDFQRLLWVSEGDGAAIVNILNNSARKPIEPPVL
jgi:hypothetical protein